MLIFTQIASVSPIANRPLGTEQSRIVAVDLTHPEDPHILTEAFHAARTPDISFDGKRMLFAARKTEEDAWHIWEMNLENRRVKKITDGFEGCTDPAYLPDGRIVFSASAAPSQETDEKEPFALYTSTRDGSEVERITFHPQSDAATTVLLDGRVLFVSGGAPSSTPFSTLLAMRYDGTGMTLFYQNEQGGRVLSRARETAEDQLVFVESEEPGSIGGSLVTIDEKRPLHSRVDLAPDVSGRFHSVVPTPSGKLIVSYRPSSEEPFSLYEFDPSEKRIGRRLHSTTTYHAVEPVLAIERARPMGFVSVTDPQQQVGWLYAQNANLSNLPLAGRRASPVRSRKVQILGRDGLLGTVPLEEDGSFHVEVPADTPLLFQTLDKDGRVVRGPSSWIWVRPNERRGCIGCHEDREWVPENIVPLAVKKPPVSLVPSTSLAEAPSSTSQPAKQ
ncbi:MAG: hypothetical protein ACE5G0_18490 [Rhodothermales bacterium]